MKADINLDNNLTVIDEFTTIHETALSLLFHNHVEAFMDVTEGTVLALDKMINFVATSGVSDITDAMATVNAMRVAPEFSKFFVFMHRYLELLHVVSGTIIEFSVTLVIEVLTAYVDESALEHFNELTSPENRRYGETSDVQAVVAVLCSMNLLYSKPLSAMLVKTRTELDALAKA